MTPALRSVACSTAIACGAVLLLNGCSVIGLGAGAAIDAGRGIHDPQRLAKTAPGTPVRLKLQDGSLLHGALARMDSVAARELAPDQLARTRERGLPVHAQIGIDLGNATRQVPFDSVSSVKIHGVHSAKWMLFLTGLAVDVSYLIFGSVGNPANLMN